MPYKKIQYTKNIFTLLLLLLITTLSVTIIHAQTQLPFGVDNVMRNNQKIKIFEGGNIYGKDQDAIRISGRGTSGDSIISEINGKEYQNTVDRFGDWFILFSITNFKQDSYIIQVKSSTSDTQNVANLTLNIGEDPVVEVLGENTFKDIPTYLIVLTVLLSISIITFILLIKFKKDWFQFIKKRK